MSRDHDRPVQGAVALPDAAAGAASGMATLTSCSRAESAAHGAALPSPVTTTSNRDMSSSVYPQPLGDFRKDTRDADSPGV